MPHAPNKHASKSPWLSNKRETPPQTAAANACLHQWRKTMQAFAVLISILIAALPVCAVIAPL